MLRFIAMVWDETDQTRSNIADAIGQRIQQFHRNWRTANTGAGMSVYFTGTDPDIIDAYHLNESSGVVLGTLFSQSQTERRRLRDLSAGQASKIVQSGGRELVSSYWGRYIAFISDNRMKWVLRDPIGLLPIQWVKFKDVTIFFSWLEDFAALRLMNFSVDFDNLTLRLTSVLLHSQATCIKEIFELRPGECLSFIKGRSESSFYWNPVEVAMTRRLLDSAGAESELREVAKYCIHTWASCYSGIIQKLSGGLDSAIVLACLDDAPTHPQITALNFCLSGANGDERRFARMSASRSKRTLIECARPSDGNLSDMLTSPRSASPLSNYVRVKVNRLEAKVAREHSAKVLFSGDGGDQLFYSSGGALAAADYVRDRGVRGEFLDNVLNAAQIDGVSVWEVLKTVFLHGLLRVQPHALRSDLSVVKGAAADAVIDAIERRGDFTHPWFQSAKQLGAGKLCQSFLLAFPPEYYDPLGDWDDAERIAPLLSQPLIELCLRIPTHILMSDGWDRALARRAFESLIPPEIAKRRSKGGGIEHYKDLLASNYEFVRSILLDGRLVREGLLDRNKLASILAKDVSRLQYVTTQIFEYLCVEVWLRSWDIAQVKAVA